MKIFTRKLTLGSFEFGDLNPRDVADTLTVLDKRALASITRREILTQKWVGVQDAFNRAGKVAKWVATVRALELCVRSYNVTHLALPLRRSSLPSRCQGAWRCSRAGSTYASASISIATFTRF